MAQKLTGEQAAIIGVYTGFLCGSFSTMHELIEKLLGRPVFTHELPRLHEKIKELSKPLFLEICTEE